MRATAISMAKSKKLACVQPQTSAQRANRHVPREIMPYSIIIGNVMLNKNFWWQSELMLLAGQTFIALLSLAMKNHRLPRKLFATPWKRSHLRYHHLDPLWIIWTTRDFFSCFHLRVSFVCLCSTACNVWYIKALAQAVAPPPNHNSPSILYMWFCEQQISSSSHLRMRNGSISGAWKTFRKISSTRWQDVRRDDGHSKQTIDRCVARAEIMTNYPIGRSFP